MAIVMEELARASVSATLYVTSPNTLLGLPILNYGTEEQKEKYLVPVMKGEKEGTFALTEPSAGSDAATQNTIARKDGDYYIINGRKAFITAAPLCDFAVVFAATDVSLGARGITAFIIERDTPGYSVGQPERKMGVNGSPTADIILENVPETGIQKLQSTAGIVPAKTGTAPWQTLIYPDKNHAAHASPNTMAAVIPIHKNGPKANAVFCPFLFSARSRIQ